MNAPTDRAETTALAVAEPPFELSLQTNAAALILGPAWEKITAFGAMMAKGAVTIPKHLQGNVADCTAVALQALGWRMNPFAVAQKTHITKGGALGYEAQLVSAVISASGALKGDPDYQFVGDWNKVLGKVKEARSDNGGKYYVATYTPADEEGLGVIVKATLVGESKPRELLVMLSQAWPRFSTQWATDPKQQICYLAVRKWARLHKPGVILGVYTPEELGEGDAPPPEKFMGAAEVVGAAPAPAQAPAPATYPPEEFEKNLPQWTAAIQGGKTSAQIIKRAETRFPLTEEQKAVLRKVEQPVGEATATNAGQQQPAAEAKPVITHAMVADKLHKAKNMDEVDAAGDLIGEVADEKQRAELRAIYDDRRAALL